MTVRQARLNAGYTQAEVGDILGLKVYRTEGACYCPAYSDIEIGRRQMSAAMYLRLLELYHVKTGEMDIPNHDLLIKVSRSNTRKNMIGAARGKPRASEYVEAYKMSAQPADR